MDGTARCSESSTFKHLKWAWVGGAAAALLLTCGAADTGGRGTQAESRFATSRQASPASVPAKGGPLSGSSTAPANIYVTNSCANAVTAYPVGSNGNVAP